MGGREEVVSVRGEKEMKMFQVGEDKREKKRARGGGERKREPRSKRFYDRRCDITSRRFLRIGKAPELSSPPPPLRPSFLIMFRSSSPSSLMYYPFICSACALGSFLRNLNF